MNGLVSLGKSVHLCNCHPNWIYRTFASPQSTPPCGGWLLRAGGTASCRGLTALSKNQGPGRDPALLVSCGGGGPVPWLKLPGSSSPCPGGPGSCVAWRHSVFPSLDDVSDPLPVLLVRCLAGRVPLWACLRYHGSVCVHSPWGVIHAQG